MPSEDVWLMHQRVLGNKQNKPKTKEKKFFLVCINLNAVQPPFLSTLPPCLQPQATRMSRPTLSEMETTYAAMYKKALENWPPSSKVIMELREQEFLIDCERDQKGLPLRFHSAGQLDVILGDDSDGHDGHASALQRHYLSTSAAESLRYRFEKPHEMSMDPHSDELNTVASLWGAPPAIRGPPALLAAASGDQVATGPTSGLGLPRLNIGVLQEAEEEDEEQEQTVTVRRRTTITLGALIQQLEDLQKTLGRNAPVWHVEMGGITATRGAEAWEGGVAIE